jgi:hypothetical protein
MVSGQTLTVILHVSRKTVCVQIAATSGFLDVIVISNGMLNAGSKHPDCGPL